MQKIVPCLWYDGDAETAARRYAELVPGSQVRTVTRYPDTGQEIHGRTPGSVMTTEVRLGDTDVLTLNGGSLFKFTPAISLFVMLEDRAAVDRLWEGLADAGKVMMPLDRYDWSERYGWVADRWGLNWQVALGRHADVGRTVTPSLLFGGAAAGQAQAAIEHYVAAFGASIDGIHRYDGSGKDAAGTIMHAQFRIDGQALMAMDSAEADFAFNEAVSLMVSCEDQSEIDRLFAALSAVPESEVCGWVKDRFGVSWQIVPRALWKMMASDDKAARERMFTAVWRMKKLDIAAIERAFAGAGEPAQS
jgi:predicted 3-demethylubiquinone-9 3-methyltransferase (glyoxalase superfamily)